MHEDDAQAHARAHIKAMASHYFTDWQVAVMLQDQQQCTNKCKREEQCY